MKYNTNIKVNVFVNGFGNIAVVHHPKIIKQLTAVNALIFQLDG